MTQPRDNDIPQLDAQQARTLAQGLHGMRTHRGEHRALREHIANRVRVRKRVAEAEP
jgi:hypothetical protein